MVNKDNNEHKKTPAAKGAPKLKGLGVANTKEIIRQRGIYLLPNLFTTAGLFWGFYAIVMGMHGHYALAAIAIFIAGIFDLLDGRVARLINAQSAFGAEYDSLADMVSFGMGPALVVYNFTAASLAAYGWGKMAWLSAFIYVAAGGLRLAKFNIQVTPNADNPKKYFYGLPIPMAAFCIASVVWVGDIYHLSGLFVSLCYSAMMIALALLMVSTIRYRSFKDVDLKGKVRAVFVLFIVLIFMLVALKPAYALLCVVLSYTLSGPIMALYRLHKRTKIKKHR